MSVPKISSQQKGVFRTVGFAAVFCAILGFVVVTRAAGATYYVDQAHPSCSDSGNGSAGAPWCSLVPTQSHVSAGDTVLIANGRYGDFFTFSRFGTEGNPITFRGVGDSVVVGTFIDLTDESFAQSSGYAHVWELTLPAEIVVNQPRIYQTHFNPIFIDDPDNGSAFTISELDGPVSLTNDALTSVAQVEALEGSFWLSGRTLYVHPLDSVAPSTAGTDIVLGNRQHGTFELSSNSHDLVFENLTFAYSAPYDASLYGTRHLARNIRSSIGFRVDGTGNRLEEYRGMNNLYRKASGQFRWDKGAQGDGLSVFGSDNVIESATIAHNWNGISDGGSNNQFNRMHIHGAPNHCWYVQGAGSRVRNLVEYNCQDFQYLWMNDGYLLENATLPAAVLLEWNDLPMTSDFVYRNVLFSTPGPRFLNWTGPTPPDCSFESRVLFENSLIFVIRHLQFSQNTKIAHCEGSPDNKVWYLIDDYLAKCSSGELTGCARFENVQLLDVRTNPPSSVLSGGDWAANEDHWEYFLANGTNPAVDEGSSSATGTTDLQGEPRPQGIGYDIGADEWSVGGENAAPTLAPIGDRSGSEGATVSFVVSATDSDGATPSLRADNLPSGASFSDRGDGTGVFSWIPGYDAAGTYATLTFRATDGQLFDNETITLTITDSIAPCSPNWICGAWTSCVESLQTRVCVDGNTCGTQDGRPSEIQVCDSTSPARVIDLHVT